MSNLNLNDIADFIDENDLDDLSISTGGGDYKRELLPAKNHPVRLVGYAEIGEQEKRKFQSEEIDIVDTVRLVFEVLSKDGIRKDDNDKVVGARRLYLECKKSTHEKSTLRKLFELMREGDTTITHFAQMIGTKAWKLKVNWEQGKKVLTTKAKRDAAQAAAEKEPDNKDLRIWEVWKDAGVPMISPAVTPLLDEDGEETGEVRPMKVPGVVGDLQFFLWDNPKQPHWDSLFIDGEYENKDKEGNITKVSKNRVQGAIIGAKNFDGSPIQAMLDGTELPGVAEKMETPEDEPEAEEPEVEEPEVDEAEEVDEIDELGL